MKCLTWWLQCYSPDLISGITTVLLCSMNWTAHCDLTVIGQVEDEDCSKLERPYIHAHACNTHICTRIYTNTYTHMWTHTHINIHTYAHTRTCTHICTYTYTLMHTQPYAHICTYTHTHVHTQKCTYTYMHTCIYIRTYAHMHTHEHIYTNTHTQKHICTQMTSWIDHKWIKTMNYGWVTFLLHCSWCITVLGLYDTVWHGLKYYYCTCDGILISPSR